MFPGTDLSMRAVQTMKRYNIFKTLQQHNENKLKDGPRVSVYSKHYCTFSWHIIQDIKQVVFVDFTEQDLHCYLFIFLFDDQIVVLKIYFKTKKTPKFYLLKPKQHQVVKFTI